MTYRRRARPGFRCSVLLAATTLLGCTELPTSPQGGTGLNSTTGGAVGTGTESSTTASTTTSGVTMTTNGMGTTSGGVATTSGGEPTTTGGTATGTTGVGTTGVGTSTGGSPDAGMTGGVDSGTTGATTGEGASLLPPTDDYAAEGPFAPAIVEEGAGPDGNSLVFRPENMDQDGFKFAPIAFGLGVITSASWYTTMLSHFATHGFVVVARDDSGQNTDDLLDPMDWLIAQNDAAGPYQDKIAIDRAVMMGYSLGGNEAVLASTHPAVVTTVSIHGHENSAELHAPVLLTSGLDDAIDLQRSTLNALTVPTILFALEGANHFEIFEDGNALTANVTGGRERGPITAWIRYWVHGDQEAKRFFWGDDCEMCSSPWGAREPNAAWESLSL